MTFDADQYKTTTRRQWEDYAGGWSDWAPLLESWLGNATERMLDLAGVGVGSRVLDVAAGAGEAPVLLPSSADCVRFERESFGALHQMLGSMSAEDQSTVWDEIETALSQYDTPTGFVGPCELVIAGATR